MTAVYFLFFSFYLLYSTIDHLIPGCSVGIVRIFIFIAFLFLLRYKKKKELGIIPTSEDGSKKVTIKEKELHCTRCAHNLFKKREALIRTTWLCFFGFSFLNKISNCFTCEQCHLAHFFIRYDDKKQKELPSTQ